MNLANELASLESELESLRAENKILRDARITMEVENEQLKLQLKRSENARDAHMQGKVRLKTLLDQTGASLVAAIQRYNEETKETLLAIAEPQKTIRHQPQDRKEEPSHA
jgi:hypothetical protein